MPGCKALILDDFLVAEVQGESDTEKQAWNLIKDGGFNAQETL